MSSNPKYKTIPKLPMFEGEETGAVFGTQVKYLQEPERREYELSVKDGKFYTRSGELFDTSNASSVFGIGQRRAIFVMDETGRIFASKQQIVGIFHHSSFLAGGPVAAAGEIVVEKGALKLISHRSGHYQPSEEINKQFADELTSRGIDLSRVSIERGF